MAFALQRERWLSNKTGKVFFSRDFFLRGRGYGNVEGESWQGFLVALPGPAADLSGSIRNFQWPSAKLV